MMALDEMESSLIHEMTHNRGANENHRNKYKPNLKSFQKKISHRPMKKKEEKALYMINLPNSW